MERTSLENAVSTLKRMPARTSGRNFLEEAVSNRNVLTTAGIFVLAAVWSGGPQGGLYAAGVYNALRTGGNLVSMRYSM